MISENIKSKVEEEEEEEEEEEDDSVIDIHHRKFVYKVRSIPSSNHPATSFHMTLQNTSSPSTNSSYVMKTDETSTIQTIDSNKFSNDESLLPKNSEPQALSVTNDTQQNLVPTIIFNEAEQFPSFETQPDMLNYGNEHDQEQMINSNKPFQQLNTSSYGEQFLNDTSFSDIGYNFNDEFDASFTIPKDFEPNETDVLHYDEVISDILQQNNNSISHIQHAPLFGCAAENLFNFPTSDYDLFGTNNNADNINLSVTDNDCSGQRVIMGLTNDGYVIVDGLSMPNNKKVNNIDQQNASTIPFCSMDNNERTVSLSMSQIPENLNEKHRGVENANSNEVVTGLTEHGDFIIANTTDSCCSPLTTHLVSVIMGLTSSDQIICGGYVSNTIPGSVQTKCEKTIEPNENQNHATTLNIIGNLTTKNEKIIIGLTDSNFTNVYDGSFFRRDSF
ncbi:unnamed protein product [Cercopithifilaria johnstoni]|uniref:Uncharacterized protein n=1 Tax=Cercopithifilaria johnstoni TaxID=2874296 RepID=A0A8J2MAP0_9BILA|nr:unnamed protein product [Cercopithifilaria johnstoni]